MAKIVKRISFYAETWTQIEEKAKVRNTSPTQWVIDAAMDRLHGTIRDTQLAIDVSAPASKRPKRPKTEVQEDKPSGETPPPNWGVDIKRIQELQEVVARERDLLESYLSATVRDPATGEDVPDNPDAWYIVECRERLSAAEEELDQLVPKTEAPDELV